MRVQSAADEIVLDDDLLLAGDNEAALAKLPDAFFDLVYMDPPFNTGRAQARHTLSIVPDEHGDRVGFAGKRYRSRVLRSLSYDDAFIDYVGFLEPRLRRARQLLAPHGTLYFHIDYR
jgi:DNA methylase